MMGREALKTFFLALPEERQKEFAEAAGTTVGYLRTHVIYGSKVPRRDLMDALAKACERFGAGIPREQLILSFYPDEAQRAAAA